MRVNSVVVMGSALLMCALHPTGTAAGSSETSNSYKVKDLQVISGPTPFAGGCPGANRDADHIAGDGHINALVRDAVGSGVDPLNALRCD